MNTNFTFMAFAKGNQSTDNEIKRYIGVAPVTVLAVNPSKKELEDIYGTSLSGDPQYISEIEVGEDHHKVKNLRVDFIIKTDAERSNGIDFISKISFFVRKEYRYNSAKTKVQVIDKYGRTAWVTIEQAKAHEIPVYSNGPANIDKEYRPAFYGEEDLTNFFKRYLGIPNVMKYINNTWIMIDKPQDAEARLDNIAKCFEGDFSELKDSIALQPNNKVKVMFGVKTSNDNKQYQTVYTQMILGNNTYDYSKLDKDLQERKANGAYSNTEFFAEPIKEYTVEATNFSDNTSTNENSTSDLPFDF